MRRLSPVRSADRLRLLFGDHLPKSADREVVRDAIVEQDRACLRPLAVTQDCVANRAFHGRVESNRIVLAEHTLERGAGVDAHARGRETTDPFPNRNPEPALTLDLRSDANLREVLGF